MAATPLNDPYHAASFARPRRESGSGYEVAVGFIVFCATGVVRALVRRWGDGAVKLSGFNMLSRGGEHAERGHCGVVNQARMKISRC